MARLSMFKRSLKRTGLAADPAIIGRWRSVGHGYAGQCHPPIRSTTVDRRLSGRPQLHYLEVMNSWPLYGIRIRTARLELRLPDLERLDELAQLATCGIHDQDSMPFSNAWTDQPSPQLERSVFQYHLLQVAQWRPERWCFNAVAIHEGRVIGCQDLEAEAFAVRRSVDTASWLGREYQGLGFGKEMRTAILHLGFFALGAEEALTSAFSDNAASLGVTRSLDYEENGMWRAARSGRPAVRRCFRLTRERWLGQQRQGVILEGIEPCLELFGIAPDRVTDPPEASRASEDRGHLGGRR